MLVEKYFQTLNEPTGSAPSGNLRQLPGLLIYIHSFTRDQDSAEAYHTHWLVLVSGGIRSGGDTAYA